jgi:uncharacterized protein DUF4382/uncharacterized protein DUF5666
MRKQLPFFVLLASAGLLLVRCGGNPSTLSVGGTGSVAIFGGDSPVDDILSFTVTITNATLTPQGGGAPVTVISPTNPVTVDFAALMDFSTVLNFASVPAGTYDKLSLTLANPQITILDETKSPPAPVTISPTLMTLSLIVNINPPLVVTSSGSTGLNIDFNLRDSVQISQLQMTGTVNPLFHVSGLTSSSEKEGEEGMKEIEDLKGMVQNVMTTSTDPAFTGSFDLVDANGQKFTVHVNANTEFEEISGLSALAVNTFVEVDAFVDSKSNIVAKEISAEEQEEGQLAAFVGLITSVGPNPRDAQGNVTQFNLFVRNEEPDESACVQPKSTLLVNVLPTSTLFRITAQGVNFGSLKFDATALGLGQSLVVHGQCQPGATPTVNATSIFLRLQTVLGNFVPPLLGAQSDGKTGGFTFNPSSALFQGEQITVFTTGETAFADVANLNALTGAPTLAVKGLLLYETQPLTLNSIAVTPTPSATSPAAVIEAKQVHQLP